MCPVQVPADEVCGCPLVKDVFEPTGEFCRVSKRKCNKHYCWEKLRRAEVDLERVRVVQILVLMKFNIYRNTVLQQVGLTPPAAADPPTAEKVEIRVVIVNKIMER